MRKACVQRGACEAAAPRAVRHRLFHRQRRAAVRAVPVVKFVGGDILARAEEEAILLRAQRAVPEAHQLPGVAAHAVEHARHREAFARRILQRAPQIQKSAALRHRRHAAAHRRRDAAAHGFVFGQRPCIQLRVAPGQVQRVHPFGQGRIAQRRKWRNLRAKAAQRFQRLGVGEAKRLVLRRGDTHAGRFGFFSSGLFLCALAQRQQARQVHVFLQCLCQNTQALLQIRDLARGQQPQMPRGDLRRLHRRQAAKYGDARLALERGGERAAEHGAALVQNHAGNMAVRPEVPQSADLRGKGQPRAFRAQHQNHRQVQRLRNMIGTGAVSRAAKAVVKAHGALAHGGAVTGTPGGKQRAQARFFRKKQV